MQTEALRVPRGEAERVRRALAAGGWLRSDLVPRREGSEVVFPIRGLPPTVPAEIRGARGVSDFAPHPPARPRDYRELVDLEIAKKALLPSAFDVIGDIVLVRLPEELHPEATVIGEALLHFVPGCRKVGLDLGVHGATRLRSLRPLAGTGGWETLHRENGLAFRVDLEGAYFSPRLAREHARIAALLPSEKGPLLDLFCGVGPFALTALRRHPGLRAVAVDVNPRAMALLRENARRLGVGDRLEPVAASAEEFLGRPGLFPRVVMNLPREGYKYAPKVASHVMPAGTLHHYEVVPRADVARRALELREEMGAAAAGAWSVAPPHVVHPYSPSADLLAWTVTRGA